jgi:hypothetical protein
MIKYRLETHEGIRSGPRSVKLLVLLLVLQEKRLLNS